MPPRRSRPLTHRRTVVAVAAAVAASLVGCTDDEVPDEGPPPAESAEPAPSGLRVAVVLAIEDGGTDTATVDQLRDGLADLDGERGAEVADLRVTVPDGPEFVVDVAALFAEENRDLVCLLGEVPDAVVLDLAGRFPATRFCAIGAEVDDLPLNVQLIEVAQEELGYALGTAAAAIAGDGDVVVLSGEDRSDRSRRRAGVAAAVDGASALPIPTDGDGVLDAELLTDRLEELDPDGDIAGYLVDAPPELSAQVLDLLPAGSAVAAERGTGDLPAVAVRYQIDVATIVDRAIERLIDDEPADRGEVGLADRAFSLDLADAPPAVVEAVEAALERLVAGVVELPASPGTEGEEGDGDGDASGEGDGEVDGDTTGDGTGAAATATIPDVVGIAP